MFKFQDKILEQSEELLRKAEEIKAQIKDSGDDRPYVLFASLNIEGDQTKAKKVANKYSIVVERFNITGGHKRPNAIKNLQKLGKVPIGYYIPSINSLISEANGSLSMEVVPPLASEVLMNRGEDPFMELRIYLQSEIEGTIDKWRDKKTIKALESKLTEFESSTKKQQGKNTEDDIGFHFDEALAGGNKKKK